MRHNEYAFSPGPFLLYPLLAVTGLFCAAVFPDPGDLIRNWGFLCVLFLICLYDTDERKIPNRCILAAACLAVLPAEGGALAKGVLSAFLILLFLAASYLLLRMSEKRNRSGKRTFLGGGDVKLLLAAGLYLTPSQSLGMLFLAGLSGSITALCYHLRKEDPFPFGPAIAVSAAAMLFA